MKISSIKRAKDVVCYQYMVGYTLCFICKVIIWLFPFPGKKTICMSEKRRDRKNRIFRTGESQEADGRYKFRYVDANGKRKSVYSWRLVATDPIPSGKRDNPPLREQGKSH